MSAIKNLIADTSFKDETAVSWRVKPFGLYPLTNTWSSIIKNSDFLQSTRKKSNTTYNFVILLNFIHSQ